MWNNYMLKDKNVEIVEKYNFINKYNKIIEKINNISMLKKKLI